MKDKFCYVAFFFPQMVWIHGCMDLLLELQLEQLLELLLVLLLPSAAAMCT